MKFTTFGVSLLTMLSACYTGISPVQDSADSGATESSATVETSDGGTMELDCEATFNQISLRYPCSSNEPAHPDGSEVLMSWFDGDFEVKEVRYFLVERYESPLAASDWAQTQPHVRHRIQGVSPTILNVSGYEALSYQVEGEDALMENNTDWFIVVKPEVESPTVYLITLTAIAQDSETKAQYAEFLHSMLETLTLPGSP